MDIALVLGGLGVGFVGTRTGIENVVTTAALAVVVALVLGPLAWMEARRWNGLPAPRRAMPR